MLNSEISVVLSVVERKEYRHGECAFKKVLRRSNSKGNNRAMDSRTLSDLAKRATERIQKPCPSLVTNRRGRASGRGHTNPLCWSRRMWPMSDGEDMILDMKIN